MRSFRIHSCNNFLIYHTAALAIVITLYLVSSVCIKTSKSVRVDPTLEHIFSNWLNKLESLAQVEEQAHFMWRESVQKEIMR